MGGATRPQPTFPGMAVKGMAWGWDDKQFPELAGASDLSPTPLLKERGFGANPGDDSGGIVASRFFFSLPASGEGPGMGQQPLGEPGRSFGPLPNPSSKKGNALIQSTVMDLETFLGASG
jgi:hypothetical protein